MPIKDILLFIAFIYLIYIAFKVVMGDKFKKYD